MSNLGLSNYLFQNPTLTLLLICHFLSDFHLQSQEVADRKNRDKIYFLTHLIWVGFPLVILTIMLPKIWVVALLTFLSHALIDFGKPYLTKFLKLSALWAFILDKVLHLTVIFYLSIFVRSMSLPSFLTKEVLNFILFTLLITKPTNIIFKICFQKYQPQDSQNLDTIQGAGTTIGLLERVIMGICIIFNQFAFIGLVFTAKSIARYNKISESPAFAEYYLIGSLFSILSVLLAAWICLF